MKRFEEIKVLGDGAFGIVTKYRDKETGELVAIKKMKQRYSTFDECLQLKEIKSLRKIKHENVIKLLQVFRENEYLYLVFELLPDGSLLDTLQNHNGPFNEGEIRSIIYQLLLGLSYVHKQGFFHRDIKPENLLWSGHTLKIADFGLAREIRSRPPYTEYVSTRWYRAPEIILKQEFYNSPVDIWAVGAIMAELYLRKPLFQGNYDTDQLFKIIAIMGTPNSKTWPDGIKYANRLGIKFPQNAAVNLATIIPNASPAAIDLIGEMLRYDPLKRPSAQQALQHYFFKGERIPVRMTPVNTERKKAEPEKNANTDIAKPDFSFTPSANNFNPANNFGINNNQFSSKPSFGISSDPFELPPSNPASPAKPMNTYQQRNPPISQTPSFMFNTSPHIKAAPKPRTNFGGFAQQAFQPVPSHTPFRAVPIDGTKSAKPEYNFPEDDIFDDLF